uniref:ATG16 domain-containing protein n=1 Tax=Rhabditophanes sp. KR3021 TaxID=114890 RepID=A0AC35TL73_9BILA
MKNNQENVTKDDLQENNHKIVMSEVTKINEQINQTIKKLQGRLDERTERNDEELSQVQTDLIETEKELIKQTNLQEEAVLNYVKSSQNKTKEIELLISDLKCINDILRKKLSEDVSSLTKNIEDNEKTLKYWQEKFQKMSS